MNFASVCFIVCSLCLVVSVTKAMPSSAADANCALLDTGRTVSDTASQAVSATLLRPLPENNNSEAPIFIASEPSLLLATKEESDRNSSPSNKNKIAVLSSAKKESYSPQIEVGPFDIHKKYRSMEGPYVIHKFAISDLVACGKVYLPENTITYLDKPGGKLPSMLKQTNMESKGDPLGIVSSNKPTELLWLHGIKIQVLDEHDKLLPTAEFICHMNLDVDLVTRYTAFPELEKTGFERMITLTQGQTEFYFPEGYAVPVSSDEEWKFTFQAANRTTNKHRRIKQVCTLSFLQDADLKSPPKALHWFNPYISVQSSDNSAAPHHMGPDCMQFSTGTNAPNMVPGSEFKNQSGVTMLPHWAVPPGSHTYTIPLSGAEDKDLGSSDQVIHAVWTHLHPACARAALIECTGRAKRAIFDVHAETSYNPGAELKHIDTILSPKGIAFKAGQNYELLATYDNPSKSDLDSMVVFGIFCESKSFVKPAWLKDQNLLGGTSSSNGQADCDRYCGIKHSNK